MTIPAGISHNSEVQTSCFSHPAMRHRCEHLTGISSVILVSTTSADCFYLSFTSVLLRTIAYFKRKYQQKATATPSDEVIISIFVYCYVDVKDVKMVINYIGSILVLNYRECYSISALF